jgi:hypothetical protein
MTVMTPASPNETKPVQIFVSYSHRDAAWFARLRPLLKFRMSTANVVHIWHDQQLKMGDRWDKQIRAALESADIFICLVSYHFLDSDYIMDVEVPAALARAHDGLATIVPIVLVGMDLEEEYPELHAFQRLPDWDKCWRDYEQGDGDYEHAHEPIRRGLRQAIEQVHARR